MGFDNECILNIQSLAGEYFCPVCRLLVYPNEALQSQCTHLYCKPCLTYIVSTTRACPYDGYLVTEADSKPLIESNKTLADTIGKIAVHCLYHRSGCTWQGPLSECITHCSGCAFGNSPVVCNRCGIQIVHRQVQEHAQNCPGVQPQVQHPEGAQNTSASGTVATTDQASATSTSASVTSEVQPSQTAAVTVSGPHPTQQATTSSHAQPVVQAPGQDPNLWYQQQQQQFQQYYQQYPGYDPYQQQYQHYYAYQQSGNPQYQQPQPSQAHLSHAAGQHLTQSYVQPQTQTQPPSQPQLQIPPQTQPQPLPQSQPQPLHRPQPQPLLQGHSQSHAQVQTPVASQPQNQGQVSQQQSYTLQAQQPAYGQPQPHSQSHPQGHPHPQQHIGIPQYQQSLPQIQHLQGPTQQQGQPQFLPQQPPLSQSQPHSHSQSQSQSQSQPHPQVQNLQLNQTLDAAIQPQAHNTSGQAVTGYHSCPQPALHQQMQLGATQHLMQPQPQGGPHPQSQNAVQFQSQLPQEVPVMHPAGSHTMYQNQQHQPFLPSAGQPQSILLAQQLPVPSHTQQPAQPTNQRPVLQAVPQQYVQQPQTFPRQGQFISQQVPVPPQLRPHGPPQSLPQAHGHLHPQQNVAPSQGLQQSQPQNLLGRSAIPNQGVQSLPHSQSVAEVQLRRAGTVVNQMSMNHGNVYWTNNRMQFLEPQSGVASRQAVPDGLGQQNIEKLVTEQEGDSSSQKAAKRVAGNVDGTLGHGASSGELKAANSEAGLKKLDGDHKIDSDCEYSQVDASAKDIPQLDLHEGEKGKPLSKQVESVLEDGITVHSKDLSPVGLKQTEHPANGNKEVQDGPAMKNPPSEDAGLNEEQSKKLLKDSSGIPQSSDGAIESLVSVVASPLTAQGKANQQHGSSDTNLPQAYVAQGAGVDGYRGMPAVSQLHASGLGQPPFQIPIVEQGRQQLPLVQRGTAHLQKGPVASAMLQAPHPVGLHQSQASGNPTVQLRSQTPSQMPHPGQPLNQGIMTDTVSSSSFARVTGHYDHPLSFEMQSATQGFLGQGQLTTPHGAPRMPLGDTVGGKPFGFAPPGVFGSYGKVMARPPHGSEIQIDLQRHTHPADAEKFSNLRQGFKDVGGPVPHYPGYLEHGPPGLFSIRPNMVGQNGVPGPESALGLMEERLKLVPGERFMRPFDRGAFEDSGPFAKIGSHSLRSLDRGSGGPNYDDGLNFDSFGNKVSRFVPPPHIGSTKHSSDDNRQYNDDNPGRSDPSRGHPDFLGPGPKYGRHHADGFASRSSLREYHGMPSRGFGGHPGGPALDEVDGWEVRRIGGPHFNSVQDSRYPLLPGHLRRVEFEGPGNLIKSGDLIGQDRQFGPTGIPGRLLLGEPGNFGAHIGRGQVGELAGPGSFEPFGANRPNRTGLGEPAFRNNFSFRGFPDDGGMQTGVKETFDVSKRRKSGSMGWCRICKVDCETVEGLDLHSQTREHQKMALDIVRSIKLNAKKQKLTSGEHSSLEDLSKSKNSSVEGNAKNQ